LAGQHAGRQKVLEALCELYPHADIYIHVYQPEAISGVIAKPLSMDKPVFSSQRKRRRH
jgi:hypothetical protein